MNVVDAFNNKDAYKIWRRRLGLDRMKMDAMDLTYG